MRVWLRSRRSFQPWVQWLILLAVGTFAQAQQGAIPVSQADAVCAKCHAEIFHNYLGTPMANASGHAMDRLIPGSLDHAASGVKYRVFEQDGSPWLTYDIPGNPPVRGRRKLDYFLGSGHLGVTYLYSIDNYLLESPVAYYSATNSYDMKPGLGDMREMPSAIPMEAGCLRCHMSGVRHSDPGTMSRYSIAPFLYGGIRCESCHGDATAHVRTGGKAAVVNPAKLDSARRDSVCISCHLEGDVSVEKKGRSAVDFGPGDSISDYLSYFVYASAGARVRGVSEVEQFNTSMCKRVSGDKMSCTSCHDPHHSPSAAERVAFYRGRCLACHNHAAFAARHHPENPDCTSCHMPRSRAQNIPHVAWTDHRILRQPDSSRPEDLAQRDTLVPIFSPTSTQRDLALAYYQAAMTGRSADRQKAWDMLTVARQTNPDDVQVMDSLGILAGIRGDFTLAASLFRDVLKLDEKDLTAATNLAVLQARAGNLAGALALLEPVFNRNQDAVGLAKNVAAIECLLGNGTAARDTLETALKYSPGSGDLSTRLQQAGTCAADHPQ